MDERNAGIDLASEEHRLVIVDGKGGQLEQRRIGNDEEGVRFLCRRLLDLGVTRVALERPNGLVVDRLLDDKQHEHKQGNEARAHRAFLAALALTAPASSQAAAPKLIATVGPGFTISLKTVAGKKVTALKRGTYSVTVTDRSRIHDFRLRGPGVNKTFSGVAAMGTKTATVRLAAGRYQFLCQPHASAMHGAFSVR